MVAIVEKRSVELVVDRIAVGVLEGARETLFLAGHAGIIFACSYV